MTQVHPGINIGLQYIRNTSEIHFKVTYTSTLPLNQEGILSTQFSAQVFFSVSSRSSSSPHHLQVLFIFKSSSTSSHLHLQVIWIWIISRSRSSQNIITGSGSSLDLDDLWSSSCVYYLVIGSSTEPALFHASCRPIHQVGLRLALTSDLLVRKERLALTSNHVLKYNPIRKAQHSHSPA